MSDIAVRVGTSVAVVSVCLNGAKSSTLKVSDETRQRVLAMAEELGYRRNPLAGALATGKTRILGLMLPSASAYGDHDPFYSLITAGVARCAAQHGYNVMLYSAVPEDAGVRAAQMIDRLVAGMVFVSPPFDSPLYGECERQGIPYVSILGNPTRAERTVNSDDYEGGRLATKFLIDLGHRKIAHLAGRPGVSTTAPRKQGYLNALTEAGIRTNESFCVNGNFNRASGYAETQNLLFLPANERPTAVFAANDLSAHGAIEAITDAGFKVPEDFSVVGYDDTWYATVTRPMLTSIRMDVPAIGQRASEMLIFHLEDKSEPDLHSVMPVSLTIRESCCRIGVR